MSKSVTKLAKKTKITKMPLVITKKDTKRHKSLQVY